MVGDLVLVLGLNAANSSELVSHFWNGLEWNVNEIILFLKILAILRVLLWITAYDHTDFVPSVKCALVILERNS